MRRARILLALGAAAGLGAAWLGVSLHRPYRGFPDEGVFVEVRRGASVRAIAALLEEKGVVPSQLAFELLCRWRAHRPLQAGEYRFDRPRSPYDVFEMLAAGRVYVVTLLVPEGRTLFEIAALVEQAGLGPREEFLAAARDPSLVADLAPHAANLEGFLLPATYQFPRRTPAREVAAAMVRRFREVWRTLPQELPRGLDVAEVVTLASLVERETGTPEERPLIAGVFFNRLRIGMPLACDPTVIYALQLADRYRGTLSRADLRFPSPYNTYRRRGLPPGPIANPGEAALRAALAPAATDYLYFVANAQGGHFFGRTLREHNANVAHYRRLLAAEQANVSKAPRPARAGGSE